MEFENPTVVFQHGERWTNAGFSGDDFPRSTNRTVVGRLKPSCGRNFTNYVGDEAIKKRAIFNLRYPIEDGSIVKWDEMELVWSRTFYDSLRVAPEEQPLLMTDTLNSSKYDREKITRIMFEEFGVPALFLANQAVLSLYASGRTTGVVLDSGDSITRAVPVYEGHAIPSVTCSSIVGGRHLADYLFTLCDKIPNSMLPTREDDVCFDMKEKCYVALDYEHELEQIEKTIPYELPDGNIISLGNERFKCTEALFNTRLLNVDEPSIHDVIIKSILKCNTTIRDKMYNNIVLAGGNTMFPGLRKRIDKELRRVAPDSAKIKVEAGSKSPPVRKYSAWIGGSIFATTYNPDTWITKELYEEYGEDIVHVRCPTTSFQAEAMSNNKSLFKCRNDFVDAEMY